VITVYTVRWVVAIFVGLVFAGAGTAKLLGDPVFTSWFEEWGYPLSLMRAIGLVEILCAIVLMIPRASSYAALALLGVAGGAFLTQAVHGELLAAWLPALLAAASAVLVSGVPGHAPRLHADAETFLPDENEVLALRDEQLVFQVRPHPEG